MNTQFANNADEKPAVNLLGRIKAFSKNTILLCKQIKLTYLNRNTIEQLLRSSTSIGANYCEACETTSKKDFANKIVISKREAKETVYWLELLLATEDANMSQIHELINEAQQLVKILGAIYEKSK